MTPKLTMLFFAGAGPETKDRVDVAHLFGEELSRRGLEIDWYLRSFEAGGIASRREYHGRPATVCGRSRLPGVAGRAVSRLMEVLATLHFFVNALLRRYDIIQVRDDFVAGPLGLLAARLRGARFVFWLSYPFPEARMLDAREGNSRYPWYSMLAGWLNGQVLYRLLLPHCDHAFVQSEQMKRDVLRPGIDGERITPVPMGLPDVDLPEACPPSDEQLVLYLGTLVRVRRLETVVQAFALVLPRCPGVRLVIVGEGDQPADRAALEAEVARLGISSAVTFTGQVPRPQALDWVRRAAVCLSPFYPTFVLRSTSPTKLIEYMALGKAVVANDHPEQSQILSESGAGLCVAWSAEAFAEAIVTMIRSPEKAAAAGRDGRRWVIAKRLYSTISDSLWERYMGIAKSSR